MNIEELSEDLEQQFGKPRNVTEENIQFMLSLVEEQNDGGLVNEDIPQPSLDALGMTVLAVMSYQTTPWEELAKKPAIRRSLKYIAVRSKNHYDEVELLIKELMRTHTKGLTQKMVFGFIKVINALRQEEHPTKLIEYSPFPAHYYQIFHGLHRLIHAGKNEDAALYISCAIEDRLLYETVERGLIIDEFDLTKSGFNKYFLKYHVQAPTEIESIQRQIAARKKYYFTTLRAEIGYVVEEDGHVRFLDRRLKRKNFFAVIVAYIRSIFGLTRKTLC